MDFLNIASPFVHEGVAELYKPEHFGKNWKHVVGHLPDPKVNGQTYRFPFSSSPNPKNFVDLLDKVFASPPAAACVPRSVPAGVLAACPGHGLVANFTDTGGGGGDWGPAARVPHHRAKLNAVWIFNVLTTATRRRWRKRNGGVKTAAWRTFGRRSTLHHAVKNKRVTVQGPVKKQQPDGMSHRGGGGVAEAKTKVCVPKMDLQFRGPFDTSPQRVSCLS